VSPLFARRSIYIAFSLTYSMLALELPVLITR